MRSREGKAESSLGKDSLQIAEIATEDALFQPEAQFNESTRGTRVRSESSAKVSKRGRGSKAVGKKSMAVEADIPIETETPAKAKGKRKAATSTASSVKKKKADATLPPAPLPAAGGRSARSSRARKEISYGLVILVILQFSSSPSRSDERS